MSLKKDNVIIQLADRSHVACQEGLVEDVLVQVNQLDLSCGFLMSWRWRRASSIPRQLLLGETVHEALQEQKLMYLEDL